MANGFACSYKTIAHRVAAWLLFAASVSAPARAEDETARRAGVIFEGAFNSPTLFDEIAGAKATRLVPYYEWDFGIRPFTEAAWQEQGLTWSEFMRTAVGLADELAGEIEPRYIRDHRGVIDYAIVRGDDPFLTSVVLSARFRELFEETLGDRLHVIVVGRQLIYVFPAIGGRLEEYGTAMVDAYDRAKIPVSLEVLQVTEEGLRVIGRLED